MATRARQAEMAIRACRAETAIRAGMAEMAIRARQGGMAEMADTATKAGRATRAGRVLLRHHRRPTSPRLPLALLAAALLQLPEQVRSLWSWTL